MKWKSVPGYEHRYEVSDVGNVRKTSGPIIGQWKNDQGYCLVRLSKPRATFRVHRLVAEAFIDNPEQLPFVNHKDCDRANNTAGNLEWCTQWQNLSHSEKLGRMQRNYWAGKRSPNAALSDEQVKAIRREYADGDVSWAALGKKYGICKRSIGRVVKGESYAK